MRRTREVLVALATAVVLAGCGLLGGPPDHGHPTTPIGTLALQELVGFELEEIVGGGVTSAYTVTSTISLDDGRWVHAELLYVDEPLSGWVTPPTGADLRGRTAEAPVTDEDATFTFAERPPTVIDETFGCTRLVVNTRDVQPLEAAARQRFLDGVAEAIDEWLAELPEDPCHGRPTSPPDGEVGPPAGTLPE